MKPGTDNNFGWFFAGFVIALWFAAAMVTCVEAKAGGLFDSTTVRYGGIQYTTIWADGEQIFITRQRIGGLDVTDITDFGENYGVAYGYDYQQAPQVTGSQGFTLGDSPAVGLFTVFEMQRIEERQRGIDDWLECQICKPVDLGLGLGKYTYSWEVDDDSDSD